MSLIDVTYFFDEIFIAGLENTIDTTSVKITGFIKKYEARYLNKFMGKIMYDEFMAGLLVNPIPPKWIDLKNQLADSDTLESPIANYVYFWYQENLVTNSVGIGETKPKSENSNLASVLQKQMRSWNEMVRFTYKVQEFIQKNSTDYPDFNPETDYRFGTNIGLTYDYQFRNYNYFYLNELFIFKNAMGL